MLNRTNSLMYLWKGATDDFIVFYGTYIICKFVAKTVIENVKFLIYVRKLHNVCKFIMKDLWFLEY